MKRLLLALLLAAGCGQRVRTVASGVVVSPGELTFASVGGAQELLLQVSNAGFSNLEIFAIKVASGPDDALTVVDVLTRACDGAARSGGGTLHPGECAQATVRWTPGAAQGASGAIEVDSDDPGRPRVLIPISAGPTAPVLQVCALSAGAQPEPSRCSSRGGALQDVPQVDFGEGATGVTATRALRILNAGTAPLLLSPAPRLSAGTPADFSLGSPALAALPPGAYLDLPVSVTPRGGGPLRGALELSTNDPFAASVAVPLLAVVSGWKLCAAPEGGLDFGRVTVGQAQTLTMAFSNCGDQALDLTAFTLVSDAPTAGELDVPAGQYPRLPLTLAPGARFSLEATYRPTAARPDAARFSAQVRPASGPSAALSWPLSGTGLPVKSCAALPTARIATFRNQATTPVDPQLTRFAPLDVVTLSGATSTVPNGSPTYHWQIAQQPAGATDPLQGGGTQARIQLRLAGEYVIALSIQDGEGCIGPPVQVPLRVLPPGTLHLELTWEEGYGDVDLHYLGPGGSFHQAQPSGDLDWRSSLATARGAAVSQTSNHSPDWGKDGGVAADGLAKDDASFDLDQRWGNGPELVTHAQPFDGVYQVLVHYSCGSPSGDPAGPPLGPVTASLRIWINGMPWSQTPPRAVLRAFQVWEAATITVRNAGRDIAVFAPAAPAHDDSTGAPRCGTPR